MHKILLLFLIISCSQQDAERIGYNLGRGIVTQFNSNEFITLYGRNYYRTIDCSNQYGYVDYRFNPLPIHNCTYYNNAYYVSFVASYIFYNTLIYIIRN